MRRWKPATADSMGRPRRSCTGPGLRGVEQGAKMLSLTMLCTPWPARSRRRQLQNGIGWARKDACGPKAPAGVRRVQIPTAAMQARDAQCRRGWRSSTERTRNGSWEPCSQRGRSIRSASTQAWTRCPPASGERFRRISANGFQYLANSF